MRLDFPKLARLGVFTLAMAVVPAVLPASAQTSNNNNMDNSASATGQNSSMVPGTGMTAAELRDIGYTDNQIAEIRSSEMADMNASAGQSGTPASASTNDAAANRNATQANNGGGGGGWGLWGLVGLLGLLGLGRGRKAATTERDRERDIRRIA